MNIKHLSLFLFFNIFVFTLISCNNSNSDEQERNESIDTTGMILNYEDSLKNINREIEDAIYNNDFEKILKYYAEDATVVPNFQPALHGKDAVRESYLKQEKEGIKIHSFHGKIEKIWADNANIYEYGTYGLSFSSNETKHPYGVTGSYFMIWEKHKNMSFLIKYFISNLDFNPCKDYF
jgi:ketosteroid isomerase-like protein